MTKPAFFSRQISIRNVILIALGVLVALSLLWWWSIEPLAKNLGYTKASTAATVSGNNVLNPGPIEPEPTPEPDMNVNRDIDLPKLFNAVRVGETKDDLVAASTTGPSNCSTVQVPTLGAEELCTWINNNKLVIFTILNNEIIAKSKRGF